jgi:aspartate racemase
MNHVSRLGMVGGLGPESTIDYYRRILDAWTRHAPGTAPSLVIDSLDVQRGLYLVQHDRSDLIEYLLPRFAVWPARKSISPP